MKSFREYQVANLDVMLAEIERVKAEIDREIANARRIVEFEEGS